MKDYYYLIASLPKLEFGKKYDKLEFDAVYQTIVENLSSSDKQLFNYLIFPNDNINLLTAIAKKHNKKSPFFYFHEPAIYSEEVIKDYQKNSNILPSYMKEFIEENEDDFVDISFSEIEKRLLNYFYNAVLDLGDEFLAKYYDFVLNLRNIAVAYNGRLYDYNIADELISDKEINRQLRKSSASDLGLSDEYPFIEFLSEAFNSKDTGQLENQIDKITWEYVDDLVRFTFFNTYKVFGYTIHLLMVKRWKSLDKEEGKKRLDHLIDRMMENFELPQLHK